MLVTLIPTRLIRPRPGAVSQLAVRVSSGKRCAHTGCTPPARAGWSSSCGTSPRPEDTCLLQHGDRDQMK